MHSTGMSLSDVLYVHCASRHNDIGDVHMCRLSNAKGVIYCT